MFLKSLSLFSYYSPQVIWIIFTWFIVDLYDNKIKHSFFHDWLYLIFYVFACGMRSFLVCVNVHPKLRYISYCLQLLFYKAFPFHLMTSLLSQPAVMSWCSRLWELQVRIQHLQSASVSWRYTQTLFMRVSYTEFRNNWWGWNSTGRCILWWSFFFVNRESNFSGDIKELIR